MTNTTQTQTFDHMTRDERWLGFGYLGERRNELEADPESLVVEFADRMVLKYAKDHGWTDEDLFQWANSKDGRWFGDAMFGGSGPLPERFEMAVQWRVLRKQWSA